MKYVFKIIFFICFIIPKSDGKSYYSVYLSDMKLQEEIDRIIEVMDGGKPNPMQISIDVILMGGLDDRPGDLSITQQVQKLKNNLPGKIIVGRRYTQPDEIKKLVIENPKAYVVLFSAGCRYSSQVANVMKNKNRMFIVEPFASKRTTQYVNSAVSQGVPSQNVITGPTRSRGKGIVSGSTKTPQGINHWGALEYVTQFIG